MSCAKLRLLMTADAAGGVWTYALELCRALATAGVRTALAVMGPRPNTSQRAEARLVPGLSLHESDFALEWMDDPWDGVERAGKWLLSLRRETSAQLVHLNGYCHGALPFGVPAVVVGHSCVWSWFDAVHGTPAPSRYARYREEVRRGLRAAAAVVAPSAAMLSELKRFYGPLPNARVIHNGRSVDSSLRTRCPKEPFVLAAGRLWDEAKNLSALDAIAPSLFWPVRVAGDLRRCGEGPKAVAQAVEVLGILPPRALALQMARASIYALPALYEPFGLSVLEAASCGCALVLGDIPSLREIWDGCALFAAPRDLAAIERAIRTLVDDAPLRETLVARSVARAGELIPQRMADAYLHLYGQLLPKGPIVTPQPFVEPRFRA